jgi:hypothetical protein
VKERNLENMRNLLQSFDKFIDETFEHTYEEDDGIWCYLPNPPPVAEMDEMSGQMKHRSLLNHMSLLQTAVRCNRSSIVEFLIKNGASPDSCGGYYDDDEVGDIEITALIYCVLNNRLIMFQWLLDKGAHINAQDSIGQTVLHHSIKDHAVSTGWFYQLISDEEMQPRAKGT